MRNKSVTIWVMVMSLCLWVLPAFGLTEFKDGGTHDINTTINDDVWVDWESPGMYTTVNVLAGGTIPATYKLKGYNNSSLNISGGSVYGLSAYDNTLVNISSGSMDSSLCAYDSSIVNISGGWANSSNAYGNSHIVVSNGATNYLYAHENGQITMSDGSVNTNLSAHDSGKIQMSGGSVRSALQAIGSSQVEMSGGSVGFLYARDNGQMEITGGSVGYVRGLGNSKIAVSGGVISSGGSGIHISGQTKLIIDGSNFFIDGNPIGFGEITSMFGGNYLDEPYRRLECTLSNGDPFDNQFKIGDSASITLIPKPIAPFYPPQTVVLPDPNSSYDFNTCYAFIRDHNGFDCWAGEDYGAVEFVAINDDNDSQRIAVPLEGFRGKQGVVLGYDVTDESRNGSFCALTVEFSTTGGAPGGSGLPTNLNNATVHVDIDFWVPENPSIVTLNQTLGFWIGEADGDSFESPGLFDLSAGWHTYTYDLNDLANYPEGGGFTFGDSPVSVLGISFEDPNITEDVNGIIYFIDDVRIVGPTSFFEDFETRCSSPLKGDINNDCQVDFFDFSRMAANWLQDHSW